MPFRTHEGKTIDELKSEIDRLNRELRTANDGRWPRAVRQAKTAFVLCIIGVALYFGIKSYFNHQAAKEAHNKQAEEQVFKGARTWIKLYNSGKGDPFCSISEALRLGDGRIGDNTVSCDVREQNKKDTILLNCSPTTAKCYKAKVQCKAVR